MNAWLKCGKIHHNSFGWHCWIWSFFFSVSKIIKMKKKTRIKIQKRKQHHETLLTFSLAYVIRTNWKEMFEKWKTYLIHLCSQRNTCWIFFWNESQKRRAKVMANESEKNNQKREVCKNNKKKTKINLHRKRKRNLARARKKCLSWQQHRIHCIIANPSYLFIRSHSVFAIFFSRYTVAS